MSERALSFLDRRILGHVAKNPGCRRRDVEVAVGRDLTFVSAAIKRLAGAGLLVREADQSGAKALTLTAIGKERLAGHARTVAQRASGSAGGA